MCSGNNQFERALSEVSCCTGSYSSIERLHGTFWREDVLPSVETKLSCEDNLNFKDLEPKSLVKQQCSASQPCKFIVMS